MVNLSKTELSQKQFCGTYFVWIPTLDFFSHPLFVRLSLPETARIWAPRRGNLDPAHRRLLSYGIHLRWHPNNQTAASQAPHTFETLWLLWKWKLLHEKWRQKENAKFVTRLVEKIIRIFIKKARIIYWIEYTGRMILVWTLMYRPINTSFSLEMEIRKCWFKTLSRNVLYKVCKK